MEVVKISLFGKSLTSYPKCKQLFSNWDETWYSTFYEKRHEQIYFLVVIIFTPDK